MGCLRTLRTAAPASVWCLVYQEVNFCWLLDFSGAMSVGAVPAIDEAREEAALRELFSKLSDSTTQSAHAEHLAQQLSTSLCDQSCILGPLTLCEAALRVLESLIGHVGGERPGVLVHLHECATMHLQLAGDVSDAGVDAQCAYSGEVLHILLGVHEDAPSEVLKAVESASAERSPAVPCIAVALGRRPLHTSAVLNLLSAHVSWLSPRLQLCLATSPDSPEGSLGPQLTGAVAGKLELQSPLHFFVPVPGSPP